MFEDKTLENILDDLKDAAGGDMSAEEGTLTDHALRGAAAEFEQAYIALGLIGQNGYAETADREHLILRAKERGIEPFPASNAVWKAEFNMDIEPDERFSAGELTYVCIGKMGERQYRLMCEQPGTEGNARQEDLMPIEFIDGFEEGELTELLEPARDEEETEAFRARYLSIIKAAQAFGGNRAQYVEMARGIEGIGACKIYRASKNEKRIRIYFLDNSYQTPDEAFVADVQEIIDPAGKQGEGEGLAPMFHVVDVCPCGSKEADIEAEITLDTGYAWENLLPDVQNAIDGYCLELAKSWENEERVTMRILRVNAAIASVEGIVDVQGTMINGSGENLILGPNEIPVRGVIECRLSY